MDSAQVFEIIFAVILIGFIFVFALPQIGSFMNLGGQAQISKMIKDTEKQVDQLYWNGGAGSSEVMTVTLPGDTKLCFLNETLQNEIYAENWMTWKIDDAIKVLIRNEDFNLWYSASGSQNGYKVNHLKIDGKSFCAISGTEIYLENVGKWVSASLK